VSVEDSHANILDEELARYRFDTDALGEEGEFSRDSALSPSSAEPEPGVMTSAKFQSRTAGSTHRLERRGDLSRPQSLGSMMRCPPSTLQTRQDVEADVVSDQASVSDVDMSFLLEEQNTQLYAEKSNDSAHRQQLVQIEVPPSWVHGGIYVDLNRKRFWMEVPEGNSPGDKLQVQLPGAWPLPGCQQRDLLNRIRMDGPLKWFRAASDESANRGTEQLEGDWCSRESLSQGPQWICDETRKAHRIEQYRMLSGCRMDPTVLTIAECEEVAADL